MRTNHSIKQLLGEKLELKDMVLSRVVSNFILLYVYTIKPSSIRLCSDTIHRKWLPVESIDWSCVSIADWVGCGSDTVLECKATFWGVDTSLDVYEFNKVEVYDKDGYLIHGFDLGSYITKDSLDVLRIVVMFTIRPLI